MNFSTPWFKNSWLKSPGLKSSWLKSLGLKLGVEKPGVEMSFNRSTDYPEYKQQSLYYGVPYGKAFLIKVKKEESQAKGTYYCTIMASIPCIKVPYFSSDETEAIEIDNYWQNFGNKEYSNAKWIRENRYALASRRDESVKCETVLGTSKKVRYMDDKGQKNFTHIRVTSDI